MMVSTTALFWLVLLLLLFSDELHVLFMQAQLSLCNSVLNTRMVTQILLVK